MLTIDSVRLRFDGTAVRYDQNYITEAILREVLKEWLRRLGKESVHETPVYLPFSIDDEFIEAFEVEGGAENVSLRIVKLDALGWYDPDVDSLWEALFSDSSVLKRYPEPFLICKRAELLEAIENCLSPPG